MRANRLRELFAKGGASINGWVQIPNGFAAEIMASQPWDSLTIDMQHGPVDYQAALSMLQAMSHKDPTPTVRVPWNEPGIIMKCLDAGAYGIICPMVNTAEEAEQFVKSCRYPPDGFRSFGPTRAMLYAGSDYPAHANDTVLTFAMNRDGRGRQQSRCDPGYQGPGRRLYRPRRSLPELRCFRAGRPQGAENGGDPG